mmetsp:Transcript_5763/g.14096  ORF Transcript_5763/g.14096 Transcript_5763/m.14096 type:complete len:289 (-) Transcript_5763:1279-2145(-)
MVTGFQPESTHRTVSNEASSARKLPRRWPLAVHMLILISTCVLIESLALRSFSAVLSRSRTAASFSSARALTSSACFCFNSSRLRLPSELLPAAGLGLRRDAVLDVGGDLTLGRGALGLDRGCDAVLKEPSKSPSVCAAALALVDLLRPDEAPSINASKCPSCTLPDRLGLLGCDSLPKSPSRSPSPDGVEAAFLALDDPVDRVDRELDCREGVCCCAAGSCGEGTSNPNTSPRKLELDVCCRVRVPDEFDSLVSSSKNDPGAAPLPFGGRRVAGRVTLSRWPTPADG